MREGWMYKAIGEIAEVTDFVANGSFASLRENVKYLNEPNYAILVRLADYSSNFDSSKFVYVDQKSYKFLAKSSLQGGEIIMSNVGSLGKLFICPDLNQPMTLGPNTIVIKTDYNKFFYYLFSSEFFQNELKSISSQTALPKFNKTSFKKLQVPVPPKPQQEAIVSELDEINSLLALKRKQLQKYDKLAQSLFYEMFGDPIENEKGWVAKKLGELCTIERGGSPRPIKDYITDEEGGLNWIKIGDATEGSIYIQSTKEKIRKEGLKKTRMVFKGDFILSNSMSFGKPYILGIDGCIHDGWLVIHDDKGCFDKIYLYHSLAHPSMYSQFKNMAVGGVVNNLNSEMVRKVSVLVPPLPLQQQFASRIEQIESQKQQVQAAIEKLETLLASRMQYWFE